VGKPLVGATKAQPAETGRPLAGFAIRSPRGWATRTTAASGFTHLSPFQSAWWGRVSSWEWSYPPRTLPHAPDAGFAPVVLIIRQPSRPPALPKTVMPRGQ